MSRPSTDWIDALAEDLKQQGREAAEAYGRDQHRIGIMDAHSPAFFTALAQCLEDDFATLRARLQGSAIASETLVERVVPSELRLIRARFPWFDASLKHDADTLSLDYAQSRSTMPDASLEPDRQSAHFTFHVDGQDRLFVAESFVDFPHRFDQPEELSRHIVELLFKL